MTAFNFGNLDKQQVENNSRTLAPFNIYEVTFDGLELNDIKGRKDPNATYHTLKMSFSCKDGSYTNNLFIPQNPAEDCVRPKYANPSGGEREAPSRFENFELTVCQLCKAINPEGYEKMQELSKNGKIKTMDDFIAVAMKVANAKKGATTHLKLVGRTSNGATYANIPNVAALNKAGELYPGNNFVGDNLAFSSWEMQKANEFKNAKPSKVDEQASELDKANTTENVIEGLDLNNL